MVSLLIITHGAFGREMLKAAESLLGPQDACFALELAAGQSREDLRDQAEKVMASFPAGSPVLALVDLVGGTPFNVMVALMQGRDMDVLAGLSLPMLVEALSHRGKGSLAELGSALKAASPRYAVLASDLVRQREG